MSLIYSLAEPITGEVRYIGFTSRSVSARLSGHMRDAEKRKTPVHKWLVSLGSAPTVAILEEGSHVDYESERQWIRLLRSFGCSLLNQNDGGGGQRPGFRPSLATRQRISASKKGQIPANLAQACAASAAARSSFPHCKNGHEFTEANTRRYRGKRNCRQCMNETMRERRGPTQPKTHCKHGHSRLDFSYLNDKNHWICRECNRLRQRGLLSNSVAQ